MIKFDARKDDKGRPKITFQAADQNPRGNSRKQSGGGRAPAGGTDSKQQRGQQRRAGPAAKASNADDPALGQRKRAQAAAADDAGILTETQLKAILQSVEKLTSTGERDVRIEVDGQHNRVKIEGRLHQPWAVSDDSAEASKKPLKPPPASSTANHQREAANSKRTAGQASTKSESLDEKMQRLITENMDKLSEDALVDLLSKVYVEEKQRMLEPDDKADWDDAKAAASTEQPQRQLRNGQPAPKAVEQASPTVAKATTAAASLPAAAAAPQAVPLTKAEQMKLKWAQELAEQQGLSGYDPWGRPGAGAPPLSSSGRFQPQQQQQQQSARPPQPPQRRPSLPEQQAQSQQQQQQPQQLDLASSHQPAAIRSSFLTGEAAPDASRFDAAKEAARRQWLADLESQREAQRRAKQNGEPPQAKFWSTQKQQLPAQPQPPLQQPPVSTGFERGRGGIFGGGPVDEERRRRELEYQAALMAQAEERRVQRAQERVRAAMEDAEAERRFRETQQPQAQQQHTKAVQPAPYATSAASPRPAAPVDLAQSLLLAEETSKLHKALGRIEKLEAGGHDTSNLKRNLLATYGSSPTLMKILQSAGIGRKAPSPQPPILPQQSPSPPSPPPQETSYRHLRGQQPVVPSHRHVIVEPDEIPGLNGDDNDDVDRENRRRRSPSPPQSSSRRRHRRVLSDERLREERQNQRLKQQQQQQQQKPNMRTRRLSESREDPRQQQQQQRQPARQQQHQKQAKPSQKPVPVSERPPWGSRAATQLKKPPKVAPQKQQQQQQLQRQQQQQLPIPTSDSKRPPPSTYHRVEANEQQPRQPRQQQQQQQQPHYRTYELHSTRRDSPSPPRATPPQPAAATVAAVAFEDAGYDYADGYGYGQTDGGLIRTSAFLNPAAAGKPLPISRETTARELARRAYMRGLNPSHYGVAMENYEDEMAPAELVARHPGVPPGVGRPTKGGKDPIFHPGLVKDSPTSRQDAIMLQLSTIRQGLLDKQKEIETSLSVS